jgi:membrane protein
MDMAAPGSRPRPVAERAALVVLVAAGLLASVAAAPPKTQRQRLAPAQGDAKAEVERSPEGADASGPSEIPPRGWWVVLKRAFAGFNEDRIMTEAAGVTFYTLLALFPAVAALVSIYGFFADPATVAQQLQSLQGVIPGGGMEIMQQQLSALTANGTTTLGIGAVVGVLGSLWSANQGIKSLFDSLNIVYHEHEKRGYVHRTLLAFAFTIGSIVFIILALSGIVVVPIVLNFLGLGDWTAKLIAAARWPVLVIILAAALALIYRFGPSREHARWQWVSWGSAFAAITWLIGSLLFSWYVANFGSYDKTYGSLGAIVGFMTWIWLSSMIVLLGAELNAELEQQTHRDSTVGPDKPIGHRGAYKADVKT